jgi:hypothetical protein
MILQAYNVLMGHIGSLLHEYMHSPSADRHRTSSGDA